jgi:S-adenosylmethionine uptake transporter
MTTPSAFRGALFGLASFGSYAVSDVMVKFLGKGMNSFQVMFLAAAFTLPFIIGQIAWTSRGSSLKPVLPLWTWVRIGITMVNSALVTYTFTHLPIAQCYAVFFTMPLMITILAWPLLGEPIDPLRGIIILVGFAGVLIAVQPGSTTFQLAHLTAICGATLGALNSLILRKIGGRERAGVILVYPVAAQALGAGLIMPFVWTPMQPQDWLAGTILGFLGTCGGLFIIAAYRRAPAIVVAPMQYSQILWASTLSFFLFGEKPGLVTVLGIAVIIAAGLAILATARRIQSQESLA